MDRGSEEPSPPAGDGESLSDLGDLIGSVLRLRDAVVMAMSLAYQRLAQGVVVFTAVVLLLWTASFLYGSFYYSYMPKAAYSTHVHYYYRSDCESSAALLCSYPVANISLLKNNKNQLLSAYRFVSSGPDWDCLRRLQSPPANTQRTTGLTMLRYRSGLLRTVGTLLFLPAFLTGVAEQKQQLDMELFAEYRDDPYAPSAGAIVQIMSNKAQIYSSQLYIHAHFTGIRYLMFNFPLITALVGVSTNFIFLSILLLLSYTRLLFGAAWSPQQYKSSSEKEKNMEDDKDGVA
ncbi:seipin-like, partial [Diretmus argenteus]